MLIVFYACRRRKKETRVDKEDKHGFSKNKARFIKEKIQNTVQFRITTHCKYLTNILFKINFIQSQSKERYSSHTMF